MAQSIYSSNYGIDQFSNGLIKTYLTSMGRSIDLMQHTAFVRNVT